MNLIEIYKKFPTTVKALKYVHQNNPSNGNPYHGIDHLFMVFKYAANISVFPEPEFKNELLVAALFHDFGHVGKMGNDNANILVAQEALTKFHGLHPEFNLDVALYLIGCTEYPYVVEDKDLTMEAMILRDSDFSYLFEDISIVKLYSGLRSEFGSTLEDFMNSQPKFLEGVKFHDETLQNAWEVIKVQRLEELSLLQEAQ